MREKLIEILRKPIFPHELADPTEAVADYLLDNGVSLQKWIPVTERLPNSKKVIGGEEYIKNVAVRVKDLDCERIAFYDDKEKCWFGTDFFPIAGDVMYWCELPEWDLPQPPKEGE